MDKITQLQAKLDGLIKLRDEARLNIDGELSFQKYRSLSNEANDAYTALRDARYEAEQGTPD